MSLPPKSLIPSQWTRVPNDLTTLYEFGIMGMPIPLHVFVGEFPSDSSSSCSVERGAVTRAQGPGGRFEALSIVGGGVNIVQTNIYNNNVDERRAA